MVNGGNGTSKNDTEKWHDKNCTKKQNRKKMVKMKKKVGKNCSEKYT